MGNLNNCGLELECGFDLEDPILGYRQEFFLWVRGFDLDIRGVTGGRDSGGLLYLFVEWYNRRRQEYDSQGSEIDVEHDKRLLSELRPYILLAIMDAVLLDPSKLDYVGTGADGRSYSVPRPLRRIMTSASESYDTAGEWDLIDGMLRHMPISIQ
ncbi:hypothetical protein ACQP1G_37070 [Nocardia sp. CA-107356]|uniref:hypothetical protein n=1 Tax=Nocardia sp. CA-107356 TaxID=3239972 RepID=UPI003D89EFAD